MITTAAIKNLSQQYSEPKTDSEGVTYRIRQKDEDTLELARLIPTTCACSLYHPRMLIDVSTSEAVAISYYDNVDVPVVHVELAHAKESEEQFLDEHFETLTAQFRALLND